MSVVTAQARRRWLVVCGGTVLLALLVAGLRSGGLRAGGLVPSGGGGQPAGPPPGDLVRRALASRTVPFSAMGESRGTLGLPSLPGLGSVAELVGGTTRTRVWWAAPDRWRVDVLTATGERGTYGTPVGVVSWDYERHRLQTVVGEPSARLPRADDLLAPQAARRLLAGVGPGDQVQRLPATRVDGRAATGVRVRPSDRRSTIGATDVWLDEASGLPLRLRVVDRAGSESLVSQLVDVHLGSPPVTVTTPPSPPAVDSDVVTAPDLAAAVDERAPWRLPDRLAGLPVTRSLLQGTATYGRGLVRFSVLPLPGRLAGDVVANARSAGAAEVRLRCGQAYRLGSSLVDVLAVQGDDGEHAYLLAGLVTPDLLTAAARQLLAAPPPRRVP